MTQNKKAEVEPKIRIEEDLIGQRQTGPAPGADLGHPVKSQPDKVAGTVAATPASPARTLSAAPASLESAAPLTQSPPSAEEEEAFHLLQQSKSASEEPWLEETLAHLKVAGEMIKETAEIPSELDRLHASVMDEPISDELEESDQSLEDSLSQDEGMLEMTLRGKMSLKLKRNSDGPDVFLRFTPTHLEIILSDGMEFKLPIKPRHLKKVS